MASLCSEVLHCPEALVAAGLFAYKTSVRLWQAGSHMGLQVGFTKVRLGTHRTYKRALTAKNSARIYGTNQSALHDQYGITHALRDGKA